MRGDVCTDSCDLQFQADGNPQTFCGTDFQTHHAPWQALDDRCYFDCNVSTYYAGECGCPNDCSSAKMQGSCVNQMCSCSSGWAGADCSLPSCPDNKCSGHGNCVAGACQCSEGFTSTDCSLSANSLGNLPWGDILGNEYSGDDKYGDAHPLFNLSVLPTIRFALSESDYLYLLYPSNAENQSYVPTTMTFEGAVLHKVGLRIKGSSTRKDQKKGWSVSVDEFLPDQRLFGEKKFGLKTGFEDGSPDAFLKAMLFVDMARAVGVPVHRASFARVFINDMFAGLYFLHEDIGKDFVQSRFSEDDGSGDYMKLGSHVHLEYFGDDVSYYQTSGKYQQNMGSSDWTAFVNLLGFFNQSSPSAFASGIEDLISVKSFLNYMLVESFLVSSDNMCTGNNFGLYHRTKASKADQWQLIEHDFDQAFMFSADGAYEAPSSIAEYWGTQGKSWPDVNILAVRLLQVKDYEEEFYGNYGLFLEQLFGTKSRQQPADRYATMAQFIYQAYADDRTLAVASGRSPSDFLNSVQMTIKQLGVRFLDVQQQLHL